MHFNIDAGRTFLAVCDCGWRGLPETTYMGALKEAHTHERNVHPGDSDAAFNLYRATRRRG